MSSLVYKNKEKHLLKAFAVISLSLSISSASPAPPDVATAAQAHSLHLSATESRPARLRGVVTAFSGWDNSFFLQDDTGGIFVRRKEQTVVRVGNEVELTGTVHAGDFAPVVVTDHLEVLGTKKLPKAEPVSYGELYRGQVDSQFVEIRGAVQSAQLTDHRGKQVLLLSLFTLGKAITVYVSDFPHRDYSGLVDSTVRIKGVCGAIFDDRKQIKGVRLFVSSLSDVQIEKPGIPASALPVVPLDSLLTFNSAASRQGRVKVQGAVTLQVPGSELFLQEGNRAVRVYSADAGIFELGSKVEAVGFFASNELSPTIRNATWRKVGAGSAQPPLLVKAVDLLASKNGFGVAPYDGLLVQLDAELVEHTGPVGSNLWLMRSGQTVFPVEVHAKAGEKLPLMEAASRVRINGICVAQFDDRQSAAAFHILVNSPREVVILQTPFWTSNRASQLTLLLFFFLTICLLIIVIWTRQSGPSEKTLDNSAPAFFASGFHRAARAIGLVSGAVGAIALAGWILHIGFLTRFWPHDAAIKPNSALALLAAGVACWLDTRRKSNTSALCRLCAGVVTLAGASALLEYATGWNLHLDDALANGLPGAQFGSMRMPAAAALTFSIIGGSLWLTRSDRFIKLAQALALAAGALSLLGMLGGLFGVQETTGAGSSNAAPVSISICLFALSLGLLFSRAEQGLMKTLSSSGPGGLLTRRLLPFALTPGLLAWMRVQGQVHGLFNTPLGLTLILWINILLYGFLIWRSAVSLNRIEDARSQVRWQLNATDRVLNIDHQEFRSALQKGSVFDWTWDLATDDVFAHKSVWRLWGYPEHSGSAPLSWFFERTHPDDLASLTEHFRSGLEGKASIDTEFRAAWPDGTVHWLSIRGIVVRGPKRQALQVHGITTDVSERKHAELAVVESQQRYLELADAMPQIVWTARPNGFADYQNQRWYDYTGTTPEEGKVLDWKSWVHAEDRRPTQKKWVRSIRTGAPFEVEIRLRRASDSAFRWHLIRAVPARNPQNEIYRWFGTATEIEDYKRAQALTMSLQKHVQERSAKLAESEERLRLLVDGVKDYAIYMLDCDGRITTWNAGAERMKGYSAFEVLGKPFSIFDDPEQVRDGSTQRELQVAVRKGRCRKEGMLFRKDGVGFWANTTTTAVYDSTGKLRGFSKITRDITERKKAAEVEAAALRHAEEANRAKSEFLATMSHEIRTPMNAILGMADLLWETELTGEQRPYVETFRRAGAKLLRLINDILDLSKIEAGQLELEAAPFDLEELAEEAIDLLKTKAAAKGLNLSLDLAPDANCSIVGDSTRLRQVLLNLMGNAIKFTDSGEVSLAIAFASAERRELSFTVADSGIGIPADKLDSIFENFTQADSSTTRKYGGTGLGLGICKKIVEQMEGRVLVESTPGKGSKFHFWIPFHPASDAGAAWQAGVHDFHGCHVLLAGDEPSERLVIRESLTSWGFECDEVSGLDDDVSLRVETSNASHYSLVILINSISTVKSIVTGVSIKRARPQLPVLVLATDFDPDDSRACRDAGLVAAHRTAERSELFRLVSRALRSAGHMPAAPPMETEAALASEQPLRILVAEDQRDNRQLMQAYLKSSPHQLKFVEDGKSAVDILQTESFDLVFMDIQMPVMDGLTATQQIRALERQRNVPPTPIVALTANARRQDVEHSRSVGCTSHLSKPLSKQRLMEAIREYGQPRSSREAEAEAPALPVPAKPQDPGLSRIRVEVVPELEELVPEYLADRQRDLPEMLALLESKDFERLRSMAHNLKGTGASYGFARVSELGAALERFATTSDFSGSGEQLTQLDDYLSRVELVTGTL